MSFYKTWAFRQQESNKRMEKWEPVFLELVFNSRSTYQLFIVYFLFVIVSVQFGDMMSVPTQWPPNNFNFSAICG